MAVYMKGELSERKTGAAARIERGKGSASEKLRGAVGRI